MKLRETWNSNRDCVWCYRSAVICVIEDPCNGRKRFEDESQKPDDQGVAAYIALRYATDPVDAFNLFIKSWVPSMWHGHLLDTDDNAGQFVRDAIERLK